MEKNKRDFILLMGLALFIGTVGQVIAETLAEIGDGLAPHALSADNTCWAILVDNSGVVSTASHDASHCKGT